MLHFIDSIQVSMFIMVVGPIAIIGLIASILGR